jgi:hypothetical protein
MISVSSVSVAQALPPGGTTSWEIKELEAIVTFVLFDPADPAIDLPAGLRFITAGEVEAPEFEDHLKHHPEHSNWAFSFIEFVRPETFVLDGKALILHDRSGIAVWFAPVDHAQLASEISLDKYEAVIAPSPFGILRLGFWIPDQDYVDYMCARGHHAEYGKVQLVKIRKNAYRGKLRLDKLQVSASATPHGDVREEPDPFTQVLYKPGKRIENVVVIAGANVRERDCTSKWSKKGDHPLSRGIFAGKTFLTIEGPILGSLYHLSEE